MMKAKRSDGPQVIFGVNYLFSILLQLRGLLPLENWTRALLRSSHRPQHHLEGFPARITGHVMRREATLHPITRAKNTDFDDEMGSSQQHQEDRDEDGDEGLDAEGGGGGEHVQLQGDSSRADLNTLTAVNTPIPRTRTPGAIRPPDYFRTQYLSNLGIWTTKQAKHLNSAPRTEARYKRGQFG